MSRAVRTIRTALVGLVATLLALVAPAGVAAQSAPGAPAGAWVLDAYGGIHPFGGAPAVFTDWYVPGEDLARGLVANPGGGGWVLDAYGGIHPFGGAPAVTTDFYELGVDQARGIATNPGGGGWVLGAHGDLHPFGGAPAITGWSDPTRDLARAVVSDVAGSGWVLDAYGGLHPFGAAPEVTTDWYVPEHDLARGAALNAAGPGGWVLDAHGGLHPFGGAPVVIGAGWWPERDLARAIVPDVASEGGWVLDAFGGVHAFGGAAPAEAPFYRPDLDLVRGASGGGGGSGSRGVVEPAGRTVTYEVRTVGDTVSSGADLAASARATYADPRWSAADIAFQEVASGGDFTLWLATPEEVVEFSPGCSEFYSCRVGRNVIINDDRFTTGSPYWPGSVEDYRDMVVNHETGHWLGLGHSSCPGTGELAPLMMQQSKGLNGCVANPWPTVGELDAVAG